MKRFAILLFFSLMFSAVHSQRKINFPEDVLGTYYGYLMIDMPSGRLEIPTEFSLKKTDTIDRYHYTLIYAGKPRNYTLVVKDKEKGICEVDENNGIVLPSRFSDNILYSFFEVNGNLLSSRFEFRKKEMVFEILSSSMKNKTTTGGTSEQIPEVFGFPITTIQKGVLVKQ
jgi:hypothetical protein